MASEYGWSKRDILEDVYFDELFPLTKEINRRRISAYKMQLAISTNPHVKDHKKLWALLDEQERAANNGKAHDDEFDAVGMDNFKDMLMRHGGAISVKIKT